MSEYKFGWLDVIFKKARDILVGENSEPGWLMGTFLGASEDHLGGISGYMTEQTIEFSRPTGTTAYSANDVIGCGTGSVFQIPNVGRINGGTQYLVGVRVEANQLNLVPILKLHFFKAGDPTIAGDNVQYSELYADRAKRIGVATMPAMSSASGTSTNMSRTEDLTFRYPMVCQANSRSIFVAVETVNAFTPAFTGQFSITTLWDNN